MYSDILFWDLSRYNARADGSTDVDFEKGIAEGIQGGFYRGTVGNGGIDYKYYTYAQKSEYYQLPWSPYHAFRPLDDPTRQAQAFADLVFSAPNKKIYSRLRPVFDIEVDAGLSKSALDYAVRKKLTNFMNLYEQYGGIRDFPMIYTAPGWWNEHMPASTWYAQFDLWAAAWPISRPITVEQWNDVCAGCKPPSINGWPVETFWQFSANGNQQGARYGTTGDADLDLSWFNGDREAFYKKFGVYPGSAAAPPPPPPDPQYIVNPAKCKAVNIRSEARVHVSTLKGALAANEPVDLTGQINGTWVQIAIPHKYWVASSYLKKQ